MQAQVWTLIGILSAMILGLGTLFFAGYQHLSSRIDAQGTELRGAILAQGAELRAAIEAQGDRLDARIGRLENLVTEHRERHP